MVGMQDKHHLGGLSFLRFSTVLAAKFEEDCCVEVKKLECVLQLR